MPQANNRCCPECLKNEIEEPVLSDATWRDGSGNQVMRCPRGHVFPPTMVNHNGELVPMANAAVMSSRPLTNGIPEQYLPAPPAVDREAVQVSSKLLAAATAKLGRKATPIIESMLMQVLGGGLWLDGDTVESLRGPLGGEIKGASELKGRVLKLHDDYENAKKVSRAAETPAFEGPVTANALLVPLSSGTLESFRETCKGRNANPSAYAGEFLEGAIKNGWL